MRWANRGINYFRQACIYINGYRLTDISACVALRKQNGSSFWKSNHHHCPCLEHPACICSISSTPLEWASSPAPSSQPCSQPFQLPALQCCSDNTTHICTFAHTNLSSLLSPVLPCAWNLLPPPDSYTFMLLSDSQPCHLISVWVSPDHREEMQKLLWHQQLFFDFLQTRKLGTSANSAQQKPRAAAGLLTVLELCRGKSC